MSEDETGPDAQYRAHLEAGNFRIQRGVDSGTPVFYPRVIAPGTGETLEWVTASGRGTVYSTTTVRRKPPEPSYNLALIELAEGPRMMSRVEGIPPEQVMIGMKVAARIVDGEDGKLVVFVPAGETA